MKRIDIYYGGEHYSVGGRRFDELREEIEGGLEHGRYWLEVNDGEGMMRTAYLLLTDGVPLAIVPIPDDVADVSELTPDVIWSEGGPPLLG